MRMRTILKSLPCLTAVLVISGSALAQDFDRVAPKTPKPLAKKADKLKPPADKPVENKFLISELKGIHIVSDVKAVKKAGVSIPGITIDPALKDMQDPALKKTLNQLIGQAFGTADLPWIRKTISLWYQEHNLPVVSIAFPAQNISSGTLQVVVTVYKLGKVEVTGNDWFSDDVIRDNLHAKPGAPIHMSTLSEDLNLMNRNPFRSVRAVLKKSDIIGDTDIELKTEDRFPVRVYASYDNDGMPVTGRDRYSAGFNWGNVFGLDHQFSYRYITSPDLVQDRDRGEGLSDRPRLQAHAFSYIAPLPWGDQVTLFGSYVQQVPDLGQYFDQVGHSMQLSARYEHSLPVWRGISHNLQLGFDFKRSDNNLAFGGTDIYNTATNIEQFSLTYNATLPDAYGQTALVNTFYYSPGGLSDGNKTGRFEDSGMSGAKSDYVYDNVQLTRITYLPFEMSSVLKVTGQIASTELMSSEQLGLGGTETLRGYDPREASGTQGVLASLELRSPAWHPLRELVGINDSAQLLAFYDSGFVSNQHYQDGQAKSASLQSVGIGAMYHLDRFIDISADYGWQLATAPDQDHRHNLLSLSVTMAY